MHTKKHKQALWQVGPRSIAVGVAAVFILVALVWCSGNVLLSRIAVGDHVYPARVSDVQLQQSLQRGLTAYRLAIAYPDHSIKSFALSSLGITANTNAILAEVHAQQKSLSHRLQWWRPMHITLVSSVDQKTLDGFVQQRALIVAKGAQNASISIVDGAATINGGDSGKAYGLPHAPQTLVNTASQLRTTPLSLQPVALKPAITAESLANAKAAIDAILKQPVTLAIGTQTVTPGPSDIANWLVLQPDTNEVRVDSGKIVDYLNGIVGAHSQSPRSQVVDTNGNVLLAGQQGISAPDTSGAGDQIGQNLLAAKGIHLTLNARYTAFKTVTAPTSGKWIEVDTTNKHMYAYNNNALVRDFLVTAGAPATPTVVGRFAIYAKYQSQDMFGENVDGTRYFQPSVPYVNYFYADYAIHGNYWRPSSYFGLINSSHGCVGIPVDDGAWVYAWAPVGTPVIVHT